jgi:hypothetical protein
MKKRKEEKRREGVEEKKRERREIKRGTLVFICKRGKEMKRKREEKSQFVSL